MSIARRTLTALCVFVAATRPRRDGPGRSGLDGPAAELPGGWAMASLGFAADGPSSPRTSTSLSQVPPDTRLTVERRRAGGAGRDGALRSTAPRASLAKKALAVAPSGAAVAAWYELTKPDAPDSPRRYRAAFRASDGTWGEPVTLAEPNANGSNANGRRGGDSSGRNGRGRGRRR